MIDWWVTAGEQSEIYVEICADDDFTIRDWISERWMKSLRFLLRERFISPSLREPENTVNSYERQNPCSSRQAESDIRVYSPACRSFLSQVEMIILITRGSKVSEPDVLL